MHQIILKLINKYIIKKICTCKISHEHRKCVYLTFDDGPEPEITEFILSALNQYKYKATFFCCGHNAAKHPDLVAQIKEEGHTIANHTYSHIHSYTTEDEKYADDIERASNQLGGCTMFRPPWGSIKLTAYFRIHKKYRLIFWSLSGGDTTAQYDEKFCDSHLENLKKKTKKGDIILFHFCKQHQQNTEYILPKYLRWLSESGFISDAL